MLIKMRLVVFQRTAIGVVPSTMQSTPGSSTSTMATRAATISMTTG